MHTVGFVDAEDMNLRKRKYRSWLGYSNSKLAQVPICIRLLTNVVSFFVFNVFSFCALTYACTLFMLFRSELFLFLTQVKFSSMLHKRIPAEAGINVVCANPGIVDTNVVSSMSMLIFSIIFAVS